MGKIYYFSNHNQNSSQLLLSSPPLRPPPAPHQPSVSATLTSQPPERTTTTPRSSGVPTGPNIELLTLTTKTAVSLSPTTGRVPSSLSILGVQRCQTLRERWMVLWIRRMRGNPTPRPGPRTRPRSLSKPAAPPNIQLTAIRDGPCADTRSLMVTLINSLKYLS